MEELLSEFRKLVYEPEHEETICWCQPAFLKLNDSAMEIKHNEQRDVLEDFVRQNFVPKETT